MADRPAIPSLVIVPEPPGTDYTSIFAIAKAYAESGLLISSYGKQADRPEMSFPAIVCSSFAIELFLKFFIVFERLQNGDIRSKLPHGHDLIALWESISSAHQTLIAGMFRNKTGTPLLNAAGRRISVFVQALTDVNEIQAPFVAWRYPYEQSKPALMSHAAIVDVLDALGHAGSYAMRGVSGQPSPGSSTEISAS